MTNTIKFLLFVLLSVGLSGGTAHAMTPCTDPAGCAPGGSVAAPLPARGLEITGPDAPYIKLCLAALGYPDPLAAPAVDRVKCGDLFKPVPVAPKKTAVKPAVKAPAKPAVKPAAKPAAKSSAASGGSSGSSSSGGSSAAKKLAAKPAAGAKTSASHSSPRPARSGVPSRLVPRMDSPGA